MSYFLQTLNEIVPVVFEIWKRIHYIYISLVYTYVFYSVVKHCFMLYTALYNLCSDNFKFTRNQPLIVYIGLIYFILFVYKAVSLKKHSNLFLEPTIQYWTMSVKFFLLKETTACAWFCLNPCMQLWSLDYLSLNINHLSTLLFDLV